MNNLPGQARYFYRTNFFLAILTAAVCFLFTYWYYDFYYVDTEALFDSFYSGKLTEGMPFRSIYFLGNIGTSHVYSLLYQMRPDVEWISWILYTYLFISCIICLYIVYDFQPQSFSPWAKIAVAIAIYFLVFADQNIHFIYTRVSYMATGFSLLGLVYFFRYPDSIKLRPWLFIFLNLWFIVGVLTRSESATAAFLQIAFFGIFYLQSIKRFIILFLFPFLFLFSLLLAIAYDLKTTKEFYKQVEPDVEAQFCERENIVPLADMKTPVDSAKWKAAKTICWVDPIILTPTYFRSLVKPEKFIYTDSGQWERVYQSVSAIALKFWYLGLICLLLAIILLIQIKFISPWGYVLWLIFFISFWFLIAIQTYTVKVNDRSYSPLISLFIFCYIIGVLSYTKKHVFIRTYIILIVIVFLFGIHLSHLKIESNQLRSDLMDYRKNLKSITELAANKILVINSSSCDYIFSSNKPFHPFNYSDFKKIYITDGYNMPFLPYYRRYLEEECKCDMYSFPSFWNYLRTKHEEVVIVSNLSRMDILKEYMIAVHGYNLPVTEMTNIKLLKLQKSDLRGLFANLKVYTLGR